MTDTLSKAVFTVLEGFTLPHDARKILETAYYAQPVQQDAVAGVLFDFMGWLTTRKERLVLSSSDDAAPAVEAITGFAKLRNLSLGNPLVEDWRDSLAGTAVSAAPVQAQEQRKPLTVEQIGQFVGTNSFGASELTWFRLGEAAHNIKEQP